MWKTDCAGTVHPKQKHLCPAYTGLVTNLKHGISYMLLWRKLTLSDSLTLQHNIMEKIFFPLREFRRWRPYIWLRACKAQKAAKLSQPAGMDRVYKSLGKDGLYLQHFLNSSLFSRSEFPVVNSGK